VKLGGCGTYSRERREYDQTPTALLCHLRGQSKYKHYGQHSVARLTAWAAWVEAAIAREKSATPLDGDPNVV